MSNQALNQDLRTLVDDFTNSLTLAVRRSVLEHVVAAMGGGDIPIPYRAKISGAKKRGPGRPRAAAKAARGGKRSPEQVEAMGAKLLSYVKAKPGQRADQIARVFHSEVKTIRLPMQRLLATKKLKTKGQRRGMTYFAA